jgi:DNA polymerase
MAAPDAALIDREALAFSLTDWWAGVGVVAEAHTSPAAPVSARVVPRETPRRGPASPDAAPRPARLDPSSPLEQARMLAAKADSLEDLRAALEGFTAMPLRATARRMVFADGNPLARILVVGEGPGREEDELGLPFVGPSGRLLDKMFAAIGLTRAENLYITNVVNWRPPGNRNPDTQELMLSRPFIARHVELHRPELVLAVGAIAASALLGTEEGITRLAGKLSPTVADFGGRPCFALLHPAYVLRRPQEKAACWKHMKALRAEVDARGLARVRTS